MDNKFSSMLVQNIQPVESFVTGIVDAIAKASAVAGYVAGYVINPPTALDAASNLCLITFKFTKNAVVKNASLQVTYSTFAGNCRVHSAQGFPSELGPALLNISADASRQEDSKGVQAIGQDNPVKASRRGKVEVKSDATSKQVCEAVVSSIDVSTVMSFLKKAERTRQYIGSSSIGESCMAYHALTLRGFPSDTPSPQLIRIFDQGHRIEEIVVRALREAGHDVQEIDPATGEQWAFTSHGGHHVCHLDGFITLAGSSDSMTLEVKSMNRKMFDAFKTKGVALSHPKYLDQVVDGLKLVKDSGRVVQRCFFVAYCKDNSQYAAEIVEFDKDHALGLSAKVDAATIMPKPVREGASKYEYKCSQCFKKGACWEPNLPVQSCVQCAYAIPTMAGNKAWQCSLHSMPVPADICSSFKLFRPDAKP